MTWTTLLSVEVLEVIRFWIVWFIYFLFSVGYDVLTSLKTNKQANKHLSGQGETALPRASQFLEAVKGSTCL